MEMKSVISSTTGLKKKVPVASRSHSKNKKSNPINASEVFSWGSDEYG